MDIGSILPAILENFAKLIPGRMVTEDRRGIRFTKGVPRRAQLEPGWWWFVPLYQSIETVSVKDQVKDVATQSLTTKDDVALAVSQCVEYEITDAVRWWTQVHEFDDSLHGVAKIYLARGIRSRDYNYLRTRQRRVERAIAKALSRRAERWGVRILDVGLETFVKSGLEQGQVRLMGDPPPHVAA